MTDYTIIKDSAGLIQSITRNIEPKASIPVCAGNSDYSQYLEDVTNGASVDEFIIQDPEQTPSLEARTEAIEQVIGTAIGEIPITLVGRVDVVEQKLAEAPTDPTIQEQIKSILEIINGTA